MIMMDELQIAEETGHKPRLASRQIETENEINVRVAHRQPRRSLSSKLAQQLSDPTRREELKRQYSNVRLSWWDKGQLEQLRSRTGLQTATETIRFLLENYETRAATPIPEASLELVYSDDRPLQVCGPPGTGKSTFIKALLPRIDDPVFVVDVANEYSNCKKITTESLSSTSKWTRGRSETRYRFVPSTDLLFSQSQLQTIFRNLNAIKVRGHKPTKVPSGVLQNWTIVVEEAHRLSEEREFKNFLFEARKFCRKIILVCSDPTLYQGIVQLVKPQPFNYGSQS